jgi:hypothetical protein
MYLELLMRKGYGENDVAQWDAASMKSLGYIEKVGLNR